ncbi:Co2+/Mg2+ efflux protein ApaG [Salibacter sp.]|uniref:Co2+/Mg2+ efflux protein ApaG n=1 Tax=Salibacter sp. TaxID=2010995 RepID=UPI002870ADCD|nr:Co2+/Mg2+ efflux protein ApaG [Salibacter sp.]MDR9398616.1 Co2+/Mg2+ efflux protein ApaG [Salibacter sp.]MDR9488070.1 Co2+/Mg2+ efflux protein ApaG [Salibacter sp.]
MVRAETDGIIVSVQSGYKKEYSDPDRKFFIFAYRIRITNTTSSSIQLKSRYWNIMDSNGISRVVEGEGVVGKQPVLESGESYEYESACDLSTEIGKMSGFYTMMKLENETEFYVTIPNINMVVPFKLN